MLIRSTLNVLMCRRLPSSTRKRPWKRFVHRWLSGSRTTLMWECRRLKSPIWTFLQARTNEMSCCTLWRRCSESVWIVRRRRRWLEEFCRYSRRRKKTWWRWFSHPRYLTRRTKTRVAHPCSAPGQEMTIPPRYRAIMRTNQSCTNW